LNVRFRNTDDYCYIIEKYKEEFGDQNLEEFDRQIKCLKYLQNAKIKHEIDVPIETVIDLLGF